MTDAMLDAAQKNIDAAGADNIELHKGIIEELPVEDSSVDLIISNCVINLSPEKEKVFSEIYRVLKPHGRMLISDIVVKDLPEEILQIKPLYNSCVAGAISEEKYLAGLWQAGLKEVVVLDRLVYKADQIRGFFDTEEIPDLNKLFNDLNESDRNAKINRLLKELSRKVWSAKFSAIKP